MAEMQEPLAPSVMTTIPQYGPSCRAASSAEHSLCSKACASDLYNQVSV